MILVIPETEDLEAPEPDFATGGYNRNGMDNKQEQIRKQEMGGSLSSFAGTVPQQCGL